MTDKELLELAAKAAGFDFAWYCRGANNPNGTPNVPFADGREWNPLTDDGDAFRLAVKLLLDVDHNQDHACVYGAGVAIEIADGPDPYETTRRAIVRAAAEIGKGMK